MTVVEGKRKFLIIGTQRSGTTLLSQMLSSHPDIFVQNETFLPKLFREAYTEAQGLEIGLEKFLLGRLAREDVEQKRLLGLKDPLLTYHPDDVKNILSFGKAIIIVRDPRGVVNSYKENAWGLGTNVYTGALRWRQEVDAQLGLAEYFGEEKVMLLRYEDLIANLVNSLTQITTFLGAGFDDAMLNYHNNARYVTINRESRNVSSRPSLDISQKWREQLSVKEVQITETLCSEYMQRLNYGREYSDVKIGALERGYYRTHQAILGEIQLQYRLRKSRKKHKARIRSKA